MLIQTHRFNIKYSPSDLTCIFFLSLIMLINIYFIKPAYNWDLIPYVGVALSFEKNENKSVSKDTFELIKKNVPPDVFENLIGSKIKSKNYRNEIYINPVYFDQQLPFYSIKPIYPLTMYGLSKIGINLIDGSILISKFSYFLLGLLIWIWLRQTFNAFFSFIFTSLIVSTPYVLNLASYSTPDALASFLVVLGLFFGFGLSSSRLSKCIFLVIILVRPDNFIFLVLNCIYSLFIIKSDRKFSASILIFAIIIYEANSVISGSYGWQILFYHTFFDRLPNPTDATISIGISDYLITIAKHSMPIIISNTSYNFLLHIFLLTLVGFLVWQEDIKTNLNNKYFQLVFLGFAYITFHWFLFPLEKERVLAGWYIVILILLTTTLGELKNKKINDRSKNSEQY